MRLKMQERDEKYTQLYQTQDKILDIVVKENLGFYLTGGTALQRFHFNDFRYSDDLDLFVVNSGIDRKNCQEFELFTKALEKHSVDYDIKINSTYFKQLYIKENNLKIDLVNNFVFHENDFVKNEKGLLLDSIQSILANKLETSISRDEPRDLFDIYAILSNCKDINLNKSYEILEKRTNITPFAVEQSLSNVNFNNVIENKIQTKNEAIFNDFISNFNKVISSKIKQNKLLNKFNQNLQKLQQSSNLLPHIKESLTKELLKDFKELDNQGINFDDKTKNFIKELGKTQGKSL